ncbi:MAG: hypothetical protein KDA85_16540 [Planctomycetaceae bacterium]|nr:hypothetical protein [Planctomycetaceae bacterium]
MRKTIVATGVCLSVVFFVGGRSPGEDICHLHPKTLHGPKHKDCSGGFRLVSRTDFAFDADDLVVEKEVEAVVLVSESRANKRCVDAAVEITYTTELEHSVAVTVGGEISGSVEYEAGALFAKCKAIAEAKVTGSRLSGEREKVAVSTKESTTLAPCSQLKYVLVAERITATGSMAVWDHKLVCQCAKCGLEATNYCNKKTISGAAVGWTHTEGGFAPVLDENGNEVKPTGCANCDGDQNSDPDVTPVPDPEFEEPVSEPEFMIESDFEEEPISEPEFMIEPDVEENPISEPEFMIEPDVDDEPISEPELMSEPDVEADLV